jgi:SAM-dependent methyltransferase
MITPPINFFNSSAQTFDMNYASKACFRDRLGLFCQSVATALPKDTLILDYGCGPGTIACALAGMGFDVLGLDIAPAMVELAQKKAKELALGAIRFGEVSNFDSELKPARFDGVICSSVVEYVDDDMELLGKLCSMIKPKGYLFISAPTADNLAGFLHRWRLFFHRKSSGNGASLWQNYAQRQYRRGELTGKLQEFGMVPVSCTSFEFPLLGKAGVALSRIPFLGVMMLHTYRKREDTVPIPGT